MKIKIMFLINYVINGGPSNVVKNIIFNLDREKYEITLVTLFPENDSNVIEMYNNLGIEVKEFNFQSRINCMMGFAKEFYLFIEEKKFDIIHSHGIIPDALTARIKNNVVKVTTLHNNMFEDYVTTYGILKAKIFIFLHLNFLKKIDHCVCCSKSVYEVMNKYLRNITYIRNGISKSYYCENNKVTRMKLGIPDTAKVFIFVGNLNDRKRIVWLMTEFKKYHNKNEYLIVLGTGDKFDECNNIVDNNILTLGFKKNVIDFYKISDIYVSASASEGFSISIIEALENGLGLFLSDIPSHSELFKIDKQYYLGEMFDCVEDNFLYSLNLLRNSKINKEKIIEFKNKYLSGENMTLEYENIYKQGDLNG